MGREDKPECAMDSALLQVIQCTVEKGRHVTKRGDDRHIYPHPLQLVLQRCCQPRRHFIVGRAAAESLIMPYDLFIAFARNRPASQHPIQEWPHLSNGGRAAKPDQDYGPTIGLSSTHVLPLNSPNQPPPGSAGEMKIFALAPV